MDKDYTCEDWGSVSEWTQIKVTAKLELLDEVSAVMNMISNYLQIEDYSDIDLKTCYGDLIDEKILKRRYRFIFQLTAAFRIRYPFFAQDLMLLDLTWRFRSVV